MLEVPQCEFNLIPQGPLNINGDHAEVSSYLLPLWGWKSYALFS
jgi:hypothetical protein